MDPRGSSVRTVKVLEEASFVALSQRPNLITASALRDVIHSLSSEEGPFLFLEDEHKEVTSQQTTVICESKIEDVNPIDDEEYQVRLINHFQGVMERKQQKKCHVPPRLISALHRINGVAPSGETSGKDENVHILEKFICSHPLFSHVNFQSNESKLTSDSKQQVDGIDADNNSTTTTSVSATFPSPPLDIDIWNLEKLVGDACKISLRKFTTGSDTSTSSNSSIQGLLIAALSILTTCVLDNNRSVNNSAGTLSDTTFFYASRKYSILIAV